jgi:hypothetical protein
LAAVALTATLLTTLLLAPASSTTVSVTWYVPALA